MSNSKCMEKKKRRPNLLDDEMLQNIRDVKTGSHLLGTMIIAIGTGVIKANKPKILKKCGESLELIEV